MADYNNADGHNQNTAGTISEGFGSLSPQDLAEIRHGQAILECRRSEYGFNHSSPGFAR